MLHFVDRLELKVIFPPDVDTDKLDLAPHHLLLLLPLPVDPLEVVGGEVREEAVGGPPEPGDDDVGDDDDDEVHEDPGDVYDDNDDDDDDDQDNTIFDTRISVCSIVCLCVTVR